MEGCKTVLVFFYISLFQALIRETPPPPHNIAMMPNGHRGATQVQNIRAKY